MFEAADDENEISMFDIVRYFYYYIFKCKYSILAYIPM